MHSPILKRILAARIYALAIETFLDEASLVSDCMGNRCAGTKSTGGTLISNLLHLTDK
jgi:hypothetical protein